jgi:hypothetical protein
VPAETLLYNVKVDGEFRVLSMGLANVVERGRMVINHHGLDLALGHCIAKLMSCANFMKY